MSITATELKNNLGKYLLLSATEDIFITKNGKIFNAAYTIFFALDKQKIIWQNSDINLRKV